MKTTTITKATRSLMEQVRGKRVTVMGLGLLGRGVGDTAFLAECGALVTVTDLKTSKELEKSLSALNSFSNIEYVLGEHREKDFIEADLILVAAGIPQDSKFLNIARENNVPLTQSAAFFAQHADIPIIGVTGTRGKSTVAHLIHHTLSVVTGESVLLGGNVRGVSNLQLLKDVKDDSLCVMELDSWQLQAFGWAGLSPQVAVFTSFMPDHLNYYQKNCVGYEEAMSAYFADKVNIFKYQDDKGVLITTPEVFACIQDFAKENSNLFIKGEVILTDSSDLPGDCLLSMPGEHNKLNASLAYRALLATGLTEEEVASGFASFPGVPGRLQYLGTVDGVRIYNDNNATTPQATVAGLQALSSGKDKNLVLIVGGEDKNLDPTPLALEILKSCLKVFVLPGSGSKKLLNLLKDKDGDVNYKQVESLEEAVEAGFKNTKAGESLLFSPAFASFGQFNNEYERNDKFVELVAKKLPEK